MIGDFLYRVTGITCREIADNRLGPHFCRFAVASGLAWGRVDLREIVTENHLDPIRIPGQRVYVGPTNEG